MTFTLPTGTLSESSTLTTVLPVVMSVGGVDVQGDRGAVSNIAVFNNVEQSVALQGAHFEYVESGLSKDFVFLLTVNPNSCESQPSHTRLYPLTSASDNVGGILLDAAAYDIILASSERTAWLCMGIPSLPLLPVPNVALRAVDVTSVNDTTTGTDIPLLSSDSATLSVSWAAVPPSYNASQIPVVPVWIALVAGETCTGTVVGSSELVQGEPALILSQQRLEGRHAICFVAGVTPPATVSVSTTTPPVKAVFMFITALNDIAAPSLHGVSQVVTYSGVPTVWNLEGSDIPDNVWVLLVDQRSQCGHVPWLTEHAPVAMSQRAFALPATLLRPGRFHVCVALRPAGYVGGVQQQFFGPTDFTAVASVVERIHGDLVPLTSIALLGSSANLPVSGVGLNEPDAVWAAMLIGSSCDGGAMPLKVFRLSDGVMKLTGDETRQIGGGDFVFCVAVNVTEPIASAYVTPMQFSLHIETSQVSAIEGQIGNTAFTFWKAHTEFSVSGTSLNGVHLSLQTATESGCAGTSPLTGGASPMVVSNGGPNSGTVTLLPSAQTSALGLTKVCVASSQNTAVTSGSFISDSGLRVGIVRLSQIGDVPEAGTKAIIMLKGAPAFAFGALFDQGTPSSPVPTVYLQARQEGSQCDVTDRGVFHTPDGPLQEHATGVYSWTPSAALLATNLVYRLCPSIDNSHFNYGDLSTQFSLRVIDVWGWVVDGLVQRTNYVLRGSTTVVVSSMQSNLLQLGMTPIDGVARLFAGVSSQGDCSDVTLLNEVVGKQWVPTQTNLDNTSTVCLCVTHGGASYSSPTPGDEVEVSAGGTQWQRGFVMSPAFTDNGGLSVLVPSLSQQPQLWTRVRRPMFASRSIDLAVVAVTDIRGTSQMQTGSKRIVVPRTVDVSLQIEGTLLQSGGLTMFIGKTPGHLACSLDLMTQVPLAVLSETAAVAALSGVTHSHTFGNYTMCFGLLNGASGLSGLGYTLAVAAVADGFPGPTPTVTVMDVQKAAPAGDVISAPNDPLVLTADLALLDAAGQTSVSFVGTVVWHFKWIVDGNTVLRKNLESNTPTLTVPQPFLHFRHGASYEVSATAHYTGAQLPSTGGSLLLQFASAPSPSLIIESTAITFGNTTLTLDACASPQASALTFSFYQLPSDSCSVHCRGEEAYFDSNAADYRGVSFRAASGKMCLDWESVQAPSAISGAFCRNPDRANATAWCYTAAGVSELCGLAAACQPCTTDRIVLLPTSTDCRITETLALARGVTRFGVCTADAFTMTETCVEAEVTALAAEASNSGVQKTLDLMQTATNLPASEVLLLANDLANLLTNTHPLNSSAEAPWRSQVKSTLAFQILRAVHNSSDSSQVPAFASTSKLLSTPPSELLSNTTAWILGAVEAVLGKGPPRSELSILLATTSNLAEALAQQTAAADSSASANTLGPVIRTIATALSGTGADAQFSTSAFSLTVAKRAAGLRYETNEVSVPASVLATASISGAATAVVIVWDSNPYTSVKPLPNQATQSVVELTLSGSTSSYGEPILVRMPSGTVPTFNSRRLLQHAPGDILLKKNVSVVVEDVPVAVPSKREPFVSTKSMAMVGGLASFSGVLLCSAAVMRAMLRARIASALLVAFVVGLLSVIVSVSVALEDATYAAAPPDETSNVTYSTYQHQGKQTACVRWSAKHADWLKDGCEKLDSAGSAVCACTLPGAVTLALFDAFMPLQDPVWRRVYSLFLDGEDPTERIGMLLGIICGSALFIAAVGARLDARRKTLYDAWLADGSSEKADFLPWEPSHPLLLGRWGWLAACGYQPWQNPSTPSGIITATSQLLIAISVCLALPDMLVGVLVSTVLLLFSGPALHWFFAHSPHVCYPHCLDADGFPVISPAPTLPEAAVQRCPQLTHQGWWEVAEEEKQRGALREALVCSTAAMIPTHGRKCAAAAAEYCLEGVPQRNDVLSRDYPTDALGASLSSSSACGLSPEEPPLGKDDRAGSMLLFSIAGAADARKRVAAASSVDDLWLAAVDCIRRRQIRLAAALVRKACVRHNPDYAGALPTMAQLSAVAFSSPFDVGPAVLVCYGYWTALHENVSWSSFRHAWNDSWVVHDNDLDALVAAETEATGDYASSDESDNVQPFDEESSITACNIALQEPGGLVGSRYSSLICWCKLHNSTNGFSAGFRRTGSSSLLEQWDVTSVSLSLASAVNRSHGISVHEGESRVFVASHRPSSSDMHLRLPQTGSFAYPFLTDEWTKLVRPGDSIQVTAGSYSNWTLSGIHGSYDSWVAIRGRSTAVSDVSITDCSFLVLSDCEVQGIAVKSSHHLSLAVDSLAPAFHSSILTDGELGLSHRWFTVGYALNACVWMWTALFCLFYALESNRIAERVTAASIALALDILLYPAQMYLAAWAVVKFTDNSTNP